MVACGTPEQVAGEEYLYVNSNYILLALICQRVSGQPLAEFSRERIFEPLGMSSTVIYDSVYKIIPRCAGRYYEDDQGGWVNAVLADSVFGPTNVYTTVEDLAKWDENFYTGQVGGRAVIERMHQPGRLNDGTEMDYAFGLMLGPAHQYRGWQVVEHGGEHGGHSSWLVRFPERHLSVAVLFNHFLWQMQDYALKVADLFLEDKPTKSGATTESTPSRADLTPIELSSEQLENKAGTYYSPELDLYWTLVAEDDHLVAQRRKYVDSQLTPLFRDAFSDDWGPLMGYPTTYLLVFERDEQGAVVGLRVSGTRVRNLRFVKQSD